MGLNFTDTKGNLILCTFPFLVRKTSVNLRVLTYRVWVYKNLIRLVDGLTQLKWQNYLMKNKGICDRMKLE